MVNREIVSAIKKWFNKDVALVDIRGCEFIVKRSGEIIKAETMNKVKQYVDADGYLNVRLSDTRYFVHRIVAEVFCEKPSDWETVKYEVNHIDTVRTNNNASNLEFLTHRENVRHSVKLGHYKGLSGESNGRAKLSEEDVILIKYLLADEVPVMEIAKAFGRGWQTINHIKQGNTWKHVQI